MIVPYCNFEVCICNDHSQMFSSLCIRAYGCLMQLASSTKVNHCLLMLGATMVTTQQLKQPICFCSVHDVALKSDRVTWMSLFTGQDYCMD